MPEWFATFWSENSGGIITGLILVVPSVILTRLATPDPDRRRWRHRTRLERLRAKLRRHERQLENPAREIAGIVRYAFRQAALLIALIGLALILLWTGGERDNFIAWTTTFAMIHNAFIFWEASKELGRLADPEKRREKLERRIKRLEDRGF